MSKQTNDLEVRVLGMSRSGNHVVIQWLLGMMGRPAAFLNCAEGKTSPFESARPMLESAPDGPFASVWLADSGDPPPVERAALVHSYEDCFLRHAFSSEFEERHDEWVGPSRKRRDVIILRDPFNLFASRLRAFGEDWIDHTARRIWKQHARPFLGKPHPGPRDPVLINFNRWAASEEERRRIASELGLEFNDEGRWLVPPVAGGSSFDGQRHHDHPERMKVNERWRSYKDDQQFIGAFDETMIEFARGVFDLSSELERWLGSREKRPLAKAG
jgi:hypothetical protein